MKTSWNEIRRIEKYFFGALDKEDTLRFELELAGSPSLRMRKFLQEKIYALIKVYDRRMRKAALEQYYQKLFSDAGRKGYHDSISINFKR